MARLTWNATGTKLYHTGISKGVLYIPTQGVYSKGVAWNGLTSVTESPSGADEQKFYADNIQYASLRGAEDFGGTIECYRFPDEFAACNGEVEIVPGVRGNQQNRTGFGMSYVNTIGNDVDGLSHGYEVHLIYGATASPSEQQHQTINDSPELETFSFEFSCTPVQTSFTDRPLSHIVIDSTKADETKLKAFEDILYGTAGEGPEKAARLPLPDEVKTLLTAS